MAERPDKSSDDWQTRYDQSISDEEQRIAEAEANESEWSKLMHRASYTGTVLDLLLLPIVIVIFGIPALYRHLRGRPQRCTNPREGHDRQDHPALNDVPDACSDPRGNGTSESGPAHENVLTDGPASWRQVYGTGPTDITRCRG